MNGQKTEIENLATNYEFWKHLVKYRVIHKSVKHVKNYQQIDYTTHHGNSYADRESNFPSF
jgi:hypothetical protein